MREPDRSRGHLSGPQVEHQRITKSPVIGLIYLHSTDPTTASRRQQLGITECRSKELLRLTNPLVGTITDSRR